MKEEDNHNATEGRGNKGKQKKKKKKTTEKLFETKEILIWLTSG